MSELIINLFLYHSPYSQTHPIFKLDTQIMSKELFDPSKLSATSLKKYTAYFGIEAQQQNIQGKVKEHFNNVLTVEPTEIFDKFLELKRSQKSLQKRNPRFPQLNGMVFNYQQYYRSKKHE